MAFASSGLVRDHRVSLAEAQNMAKIASKDSAFPIVVNDAVLNQLNHFVGTPDGRAWMRDSIDRMSNYRPMIAEKIRQYDLPEELLAVPIIESGYKNFKATHSAGLWMFITSTAKHYGMIVSDSEDDRLNAEIETDAAMRYLSANDLDSKIGFSPFWPITPEKAWFRRVSTRPAHGMLGS